MLRAAAGIEAVADAGKRHTKAWQKERPEEAPLWQLLLLFFAGGTTSGKPVAALRKLEV